MRYRLRTLMILMGLGMSVPTIVWLGGGYFAVAIALYVGCVALAWRLWLSDPATRNDAKERTVELFHLTIRDLMWLTLVVGMGIGWWIADKEYRRRRYLDSDYQILKETIEQKGYQVIPGYRRVHLLPVAIPDGDPSTDNDP
jgi:hypothetical protein